MIRKLYGILETKSDEFFKPFITANDVIFSDFKADSTPIFRWENPLKIAKVFKIPPNCAMRTVHLKCVPSIASVGSARILKGQ
jgi:hypothetical protein